MAIQDSNAERRNLTVLSMSIIIYYAAGGEFAGDVKLPLINLHFENQEVLAYFLWGILGWFLFRYWLVNKGDFRKGYIRELENGLPQWLTRLYIRPIFVDKFSESEPEKSGYFVYTFYSVDDKKIGFSMEKSKSGMGTEREVIEIKGIKDRLFVKVCTACLLITRPTLTGYYVPYGLFLIAVYFGLTDWLQH